MGGSSSTTGMLEPQDGQWTSSYIAGEKSFIELVFRSWVLEDGFNLMIFP